MLLSSNPKEDVMSRKAIAVFSSLLLAGLLTHASASHAQVEDLVSFGTFADTNELHTRLGGVEVYEIICDQSDDVCEDNLGNLWGFGANLPDTFVMLCDETLDVVADDCVHLIEVTVTTDTSYENVILEEQRNGCPRNSVFFDGDFLGSTEEGHRGINMNVKYAVGVISKRKSHTMIISFAQLSPLHCPNDDNPVTGIGIYGEPMSKGGGKKN
jgi:hypothetical protein